MAQSSRSRWEQQLKKLNEEKEKKQKGLEYSVPQSPKTDRELKSNNKKGPSAAMEKDIEHKEKTNPFVRRISLNELINITREMRGEKPLAAEKLTPFLEKKGKELDAPSKSR